MYPTFFAMLLVPMAWAAVKDGHASEDCSKGTCSIGKLCVPEKNNSMLNVYECPKYACVYDRMVNECDNDVCPADSQCRSDDRCRGDNCAKHWCYDRFNQCYPRCTTNEMCVKQNAGRFVCVALKNENNGLFDGRPKGLFTACTDHSDCYNYGVPSAWGSCMLPNHHHWTLLVEIERGCYCDREIGSCVMERWEFNRLRWTFCEPSKSFVEGRYKTT